MMTVDVRGGPQQCARLSPRRAPAMFLVPRSTHHGPVVADARRRRCGPCGDSHSQRPSLPCGPVSRVCVSFSHVHYEARAGQHSSSRGRCAQPRNPLHKVSDRVSDQRKRSARHAPPGPQAQRSPLTAHAIAVEGSALSSRDRRRGNARARAHPTPRMRAR